MRSEHDRHYTFSELFVSSEQVRANCSDLDERFDVFTHSNANRPISKQSIEGYDAARSLLVSLIGVDGG